MLLFTDGVIETADARLHEFGESQMGLDLAGVTVDPQPAPRHRGQPPGRGREHPLS